jgi:signal transduction histidine kinase
MGAPVGFDLEDRSTISLSDQPSSSIGRFVGILAAVAAVYFLAARLGLLLAFQETNASPVWAPAGIAFAAVLFLGYRVSAAVFLGALLANATVFFENKPGAAWIIPVSLVIALGNTLEAVAGAVLLRRLSGARNPFSRAQDGFTFVFVAMVMCLLSATVGTTSLCVAGAAPWPAFRTVWFTWWLGDTAGVLIVTPLFLSWLRPSMITWTPRKRAEAALSFLLLIVVSQSLFGGWFPTGMVKSLPYLILPFLLWTAFRMGPRGVATAAALSSGVAIWGTVRGYGPFAGASLNNSLILLQAFVCVTTVTAIALAATIEELRQAEELNRSTAELKSINEELTQFADVVSHDLKAPLRGIISLSTWIADDYRDALDDEGRENLRLLVGRAHRMNELIDGILQYSRAGRQDLKLAVIETGALVAEVISTLAPPASVAVKTEGAFPAVVYDRTQLTQIFQNLIDNAVKHLEKAEGSITVSCRAARDFWEFSVRDDGPGIPEQHFERIFKIFQTLKPKDEVESTGIGLTLVKRYVERHGGAVTVRSIVGEGSTFSFTVPKRLNDGRRAGMENDPWTGLYRS